MPTTVDRDRWELARQSLRETTDRFTGLIRSAPPGRLVTADWTVADTAAHVGVLLTLDAALVHAEQLPLPGRAQAIYEEATVEKVADFNAAVLAGLPERSRDELAEQIRADAARLLDRAAVLDPDTALPWLGRSTLPVAGLIAHMVNELQIHGRDVARAVGAAWPMPPAEAALFFELFLLGVIRHDYAGLLDTPGPEPDTRAAIEFCSRHTTTVTLRLEHGRVTIAEPGTAPDARVRFDPVILNLMLFGRVSRLRAVLSGRIRISGPRPWLVPAFLRKVRMPSR
jgi:uncharacterized protein (TIGR03083 family)